MTDCAAEGIYQWPLVELLSNSVIILAHEARRTVATWPHVLFEVARPPALAGCMSIA